LSPLSPTSHPCAALYRYMRPDPALLSSLSTFLSPSLPFILHPFSLTLPSLHNLTRPTRTVHHPTPSHFSRTRPFLPILEYAILPRFSGPAVPALGDPPTLAAVNLIYPVPFPFSHRSYTCSVRYLLAGAQRSPRLGLCDYRVIPTPALTHHRCPCLRSPSPTVVVGALPSVLPTCVPLGQH